VIRVFFLGLVLGFGGVLAGAYLYPWVEHERIPSRTSVVANGGRLERFVIRLPADRISSTGASQMGIRAMAYPKDAALPAEFVGRDILIEQYKLRDSDGTVIGVASRHATSTEAGPRVAWALVIPARGALIVSAASRDAGAVDAALESRGFEYGSPWSGEVSVPLIGARDASRAVFGSSEFAGLDVQLAETWTITAVGDDGALQGTIELSTVSKLGS
jgi:hypothetical protein